MKKKSSTKKIFFEKKKSNLSGDKFDCCPDFYPYNDSNGKIN